MTMIDQNNTTAAAIDLRTMPRLLRLPEVKRITGLGRSTVYAMMEAGTFPRQRKITPTIAVWSEGEVIEWTHRVLAMTPDAKPKAA
ncbi:MAG: helix-turn-helix transcriptional regulator [Stenotrophomonas sp.]